MDLAAAIVLGLAGSLHCAGMCGPIAVALPRAQGVSRSGLITGRLLYNIGRAMTYAVLGLVVGLGGSAFALAGYGRTLSVVSGVLMVVFAVVQLSGSNPLSRFAVRFPGVERGLRAMMQDNRFIAMLGIGALNGLLPCGMVTAALIGAVGTGSAINGAMFMAVFGLGTIPMMFALSLGGLAIGPRVRHALRFVAPVITAIFGVLFIVRGMALDVPLVSPPDATKTGGRACCTTPSSASTSTHRHDAPRSSHNH
jgi:hypothetical protein